MNTKAASKLSLSPGQWQILNTLLVISLGSLLYKFLEINSLKHTAALFIGIPTFMSIALALTPKAKHITRNILIGTSLGLVSSLVVLNEGSFCVPMTAPLFLGVALIIGISYEKAQRSRLGKVQFLFIVSILSIFSLEGVFSPLTVSRSVSVSSEQVIAAGSAEIESALSSKPVFNDLPFILTAGFPQPTWTKGKGLNMGDRRSVHFSGGEGEPGTVIFEVTERGNNWVRFSLIEDTSHISHWLTWKTSEIHWQAVSTTETKVKWTLNYDRQLDPAWYFGPIEKMAVALTTKALINNLASP